MGGLELTDCISVCLLLLGPVVVKVSYLLSVSKPVYFHKLNLFGEGRGGTV